MRPSSVMPAQQAPPSCCEHEAELAAAHKKIENLEVALTSARRIATAVGIAMAELKLTDDQAFALLVDLSQRTHRKVRDVADEIVFTGALPTPE